MTATVENRAVRWAEYAKANPEGRRIAAGMVDEIHGRLNDLWMTHRVPANLIPDVLEEAFEQWMGMDFEPTLPEALRPDGDEATMLYNGEIASDWIEAVQAIAKDASPKRLLERIVECWGGEKPYDEAAVRKLLDDVRAAIAEQSGLKDEPHG